MIIAIWNYYMLFYLILIYYHWKCFYYYSTMEVADEVLASKTSTSTTTGDHGILNCNPTSFFLSYKCRHCYSNHCFLASIDD